MGDSPTLRSTDRIISAESLVQCRTPVSHFGDEQLKNRYQRIIHAAWVAGGNAHAAGLEWDDDSLPLAALDNLQSLLDAEVPPAAEAPFAVLPETIAPVVSLSLDPPMEIGIYMVVDTGASTTETSVFAVGLPGADQRVLCYFDVTSVVGANDLRLAAGDQGAVGDVVTRIRRQFFHTFREGRRVDEANRHALERWRRLAIVLSGGGTREDAIEALFWSELREDHLMNWGAQSTCRRHQPGALSGLPGQRVDRTLFGVANGCAVERVKWPRYDLPHEIEPLTSEPPQMKPDGYWYLND